MGDFDNAYPEYAATSRLDDLRATEYGYLDDGGHVYLDYTGAGLPSRSQLRAHARRIRSGAYGNPHSENPTSSASTELIEQARAAILKFFNASPRTTRSSSRRTPRVPADWSPRRIRSGEVSD